MNGTFVSSSIKRLGYIQKYDWTDFLSFQRFFYCIDYSMYLIEGRLTFFLIVENLYVALISIKRVGASFHYHFSGTIFFNNSIFMTFFKWFSVFSLSASHLF